jgi:hypothetical protein
MARARRAARFGRRQKRFAHLLAVDEQREDAVVVGAAEDPDAIGGRLPEHVVHRAEGGEVGRQVDVGVDRRVAGG